MEMDEKSILIGVTGSIAAYRACDLVRNLKKKGYPVQVVMTANATRFVSPLTFETLSDHTVYSGNWDEGMVHIRLKNLAALFAIVPATANSIGKFASGIADDIVSTTYLAATCPVVVAPAMNPNMYASRPVQRNLEILRKDGVIILEPDEGEVVCGDEGQGKLAKITDIEERLAEIYRRFISGSGGNQKP